MSTKLAEKKNLANKKKVSKTQKLGALIRAHINQKEYLRALTVYNSWPQHQTWRPLPGSAYVALLKACIKLKDIEQGRSLHAHVSSRGVLRTDAFVGCALVDMYAKCGDLTCAQEVFDVLPVRHVASWTALITAYVANGQGDMAIRCFEQLQQEGLSSDAVLYTCILKACSSIKYLDKGRHLHSDVTKKGFEKEHAVVSTLVDMYAKCRSIVEAEKVFNILAVHNVVEWTALIAGYTDHGMGKEALDCFKKMRQEGVHPDGVTYICSLRACSLMKDSETGQTLGEEISRKGLEDNLLIGSTLVDMYAKCGLLSKAKEAFDNLPVRDAVSWTSLMDGYAEYGDPEEALSFFGTMQQQCISPSMGTLVCGLKACSNSGSSLKGQELHLEITRRGLERELLVGNALVDVYAKCGLLPDGRYVLDRLPTRDVITWSALIAGYAQRGETDNMFQTFGRMIIDGTKPNLTTFGSVLYACNHAGLVEKALSYFEIMCDDYSLIPTLDHYSCMIDLLCRAGYTGKVLAMIKMMPFHPGIIVWHIVLGACRKWGNVELGRHAFENAVRLDAKDVTSYITMYNIYANASMQKEASKIEAMRILNQAWIKPSLNGSKLSSNV